MHFVRAALLYGPMVSRSEDYVEYCRETARHLHNIQDLALRGKNKQAITRRIQERIVREVELRPDDDVLDIGCGDGTLLRMAKTRGAHSAIGLLFTEEEAAIVRRLGIEVRQGLTDQLPLPDESVSVVVCNNVLLVVPREKVPASLREFHRVAKPGARIFVGEIPLEPGPPPEPEFPTARETLAYLYRQHGFRTWFGMLRRMLYWKLTSKPMVIRGGITISFFAEPSEFAALAAEAGLELVRCWHHDDWPANRYNYLFRKATAVPTAATAETVPHSSPAA
jgi:ubiquinone/menaquinone biosynthesis C-methylase UbiE